MDINNAPVTPRELLRFSDDVRRLVDSVDEASVDTLVVVRRAGNLEYVAISEDGNATSAVDQLTAGRHRLAAFASHIGFSPSPDEPIGPAWVIVVVGRGQPAHTIARRLAGPGDAWSVVPPGDLPWVLASTAAGLRAMIMNGEPLDLKRTSDPGRFQTPGQNPFPNVDGNDLI